MCVLFPLLERIRETDKHRKIIYRRSVHYKRYTKDKASQKFEQTKGFWKYTDQPTWFCVNSFGPCRPCWAENHQDGGAAAVAVVLEEA